MTLTTIRTSFICTAAEAASTSLSYCVSSRYTARVELSTKVLDSPEKLQRTLCHELCHVATWLLDHVAKPPHGPHFKAWAAAAMRVHPHLDITTCHQYDIHFAWRWQCSNPG